METVISNIPMLVIMLILVIPVAILGMRLAEKVKTLIQFSKNFVLQ